MDEKQLQETLVKLAERCESLDKKSADLEAKAKILEDRASDLEKIKANLAGTPTAGVHTNSDEQKALKFFGVKDVRELVNVNTEHKFHKHVPADVKASVKNLKRELDVARMICVRFHGAKADYIGKTEDQDRAANLKHELEASRYGKDTVLPKLKAYTTGANTDWLAEITAASYMEEFELDRKVTGLFRELPMPSSPYNLPVQDDTTIARIATENTQVTDATFNTSRIQMEAVKLFQHSVIPEEMTEDSAPAILPTVRDDVVSAQERAYEQAIINGQKSGVLDTVAIAADDARKAWDGLRKLGQDNTAFGGDFDFSGAMTGPKLHTFKKQGGKYTVNPMALAWILSPSAYHQMVGLDVFTTAEKFGNTLFTNLTGVLGVALGIPVFVSEYLTEDMTNAGIIDGVTETHTGMLLVNRQRFFMGERRPIRVRVQQDLPYQDRWLLSSYSRKDYKGHVQDATETSVVYGYNITA